jgi:hypothetical protein
VGSFTEYPLLVSGSWTLNCTIFCLGPELDTFQLVGPFVGFGSLTLWFSFMGLLVIRVVILSWFFLVTPVHPILGFTEV